MKAMNTLLAEGVDGWDDMEKAIGNAASVQDSAASRTKGLSAAWETLQGVMETLMIKAGLPLIQDVLTPLVKDNIIPLVEWVSELDPKFMKWGLAIGAVMAAAGPLMMILGPLVGVVGALLSPVGLVIAGIVALGAVFVESQGGIQGAAETIGNLWTRIQEFGAGLLGTVQGAISSVMEAVGPVIAELSEFWGEKWALMQQVFSAAWNRIQGIAHTIIGAVTEFIKEKAEQATSFFSLKFHGIIVWFEQNMPLIQETIDTVMTYVQGVIRNVLDSIVAVWNWAWPYIQTILNGVWEHIKNIVSTAINVVLGVIKAIMQAINGDWEGAWNTIKGVADTIWEGIKSAVEITLNTILGLFGTNLGEIIAAIQGKVEDFINVGRNIVQGLKDGIKAAWGGIQGMFEKLLEKLPQWAQDLLGIHSASKVFTEIGERIPEGLVKGIMSGEKILQGAMGDLADVTMAGFPSFAEIFARQFSKTSLGETGIGDGIKRLTEATDLIPSFAEIFARQFNKTALGDTGIGINEGWLGGDGPDAPSLTGLSKVTQGATDIGRQPANEVIHKLFIQVISGDDKQSLALDLGAAKATSQTLHIVAANAGAII